MKKVLMILGIVFLVVVVGIVALLMFAQSSGSQHQEDFFAALYAGDTAKLTGMMHPELQKLVDAPVLAVLAQSMKENLGAFKGLSKTNFNTSSSYENGVKKVESSGEVLFEKGTATSELVYMNDLLTSFNVKSPKLPVD